jgi:hypothetical protein
MDLGKGLGRRIAPDERDKRHLMRAAVGDVPEYILPPFRYYRTSTVLDQGPFPHCVGYAWRLWLSSAPLMTKGGPGPVDIYREAQDRDEWPGSMYDGTSVRGGAKALAERGHITEYLWSFTLEDTINWLLMGRGSVVAGTNWYSGMLVPDRQGMIRPSGRWIGGHAWLLIGANTQRGVARLQNSWGSEWGQRGRASISFEDLERLIREEGEMCTATEVRR